jgi:phosphoglycolate phosphatase
MIHCISGKTEEIQNVFFDLDGTITESGPGIINAVRYMLDRVGMTEDDEDNLRSFIGPPTTDNLKRLYNFTEEKAQHAYTFFREYYVRQGVYESRLYDGIVEAIEDIRRSGKRVYLATAKPEHIAMMVVNHFGILSLFDRVFAVRRDIGIFDKLQVMQSVAAELGSIPGPAMVGDRCFDIEGGRAVGFVTVGVLYGYGSREELLAAKSDYLLDSVGDLSALLGGTDEGIVYRI